MRSGMDQPGRGKADDVCGLPVAVLGQASKDTENKMSERDPMMKSELDGIRRRNQEKDLSYREENMKDEHLKTLQELWRHAINFGSQREADALSFAISAIERSRWVAVEDGSPPAKEGWNHSEPCLLRYAGSETQVSKYSVGYFHYESAYAELEPGWVDFNDLGRIPEAWMPIEPYTPKEQI